MSGLKEKFVGKLRSFKDEWWDHEGENMRKLLSQNRRKGKSSSEVILKSVKNDTGGRKRGMKYEGEQKCLNEQGWL